MHRPLPPQPTTQKKRKILVDDGDEVETGVSFVDYFVFLVVDEIAHLGFAGDHQLVNLRA